MLSADTLKKLEHCQAELAEMFIAETQTAKWPPNERETRGDLYWLKKNAGATATLIVKIQTILDVALKRQSVVPEEPVPGEAEEETEPHASMATSAMSEAQRIIDRHTGRFRKPKR